MGKAVAVKIFDDDDGWKIDFVTFACVHLKRSPSLYAITDDSTIGLTCFRMFQNFSSYLAYIHNRNCGILRAKKNAKFRMCWRLSLLADANEPAPCEHFDNLHFVLTETREHEIQNETTNETNETNEKSQQHVHKNAYAASTTSQIHPISPQLKWFIVSNHILCIIRIQIGLSATAVVCRVREREKRHEKKAKHRQQRNCTMYIATWNCLANAIIWSVRVQ